MVKKLIFFDCHENYWKNHKKIKDSKYVNEFFFEKFFDLFFGKKHEKKIGNLQKTQKLLLYQVFLLDIRNQHIFL